MASVPDVYQDIYERLLQLLVEVRSRYKRATKLDAYVYRIRAQRRIAEKLWDTTRPNYRIWESAFMNARPVPSWFPLIYTPQLRYDKPPRIPQLNTEFSRWENIALSPVRWFAKPYGHDPEDKGAMVISEAGVTRAGVLIPVGKVDDTHYRFCDSEGCLDVYFEVDPDGQDWVKFDFSGYSNIEIRAVPKTTEIAQECEFDTWEGRLKTFTKILAFGQFIIGKASLLTAKEALTNIFSEGQNPVSVVQESPRYFLHELVGATCRGLLESDKDTIQVGTVYACLNAKPYLLDVRTTDGTRYFVLGMAGYQYYYNPEACPPDTYCLSPGPVPPCGDIAIGPGPEPIFF